MNQQRFSFDVLPPSNIKLQRTIAALAKSSGNGSALGGVVTNSMCVVEIASDGSVIADVLSATPDSSAGVVVAASSATNNEVAVSASSLKRRGSHSVLLIPKSGKIDSIGKRRRSSTSSNSSSATSTTGLTSDEQRAATMQLISGEFPLLVAARTGFLECIALLLKSPLINVNQTDIDMRWTALFHAAAVGQQEAVVLLLKHGASRYLKDKDYQLAHKVAANLGHALISAIIEADPKVVHVHDACEQGQLLIVTALFKQGCPPAYRDERDGKLRYV